MEENIYLLKEKFDKIRNQNWIEGDRKNTGSIGLLFEQLLGKETENFELPDFNGIEIKVKGKSLEKDVTLFNSAPDSYFMEVYRLKETYGYPDKDYQEFNVFNVKVMANRKTKIPSGYKAQLYINAKAEIVELIIYNKNNELVDDKSSWSFALLKEKLERKLSYLAYVEADSKFINGKKYFKYNTITFYKLRDFNVFLSLLKKGKINITFSAGIRKTPGRIGQKYDHGTSFRINKDDLHFLFEKIKV